MKLNLPTDACDQERLESFLSGDLSEAEEREFTLHLNSCERCRCSLGEQAAEPEAWREAEILLKPSQFDSQSADEPNRSIRQPLQIQNVLDALGPTDDPQMLGRLGSYEVSGVVGSGGMGVVLKAIDKSLDRTVAIKVMAPHLATSGAARKRFAREAKAAAAVLHSNVIAIHSVSNDEALPYLVMPYVRGTSLQRRLDREGPLPLREILRIGAQIAAGLAAAHAQGLVHRDIKPANILLEEGVERVTITDFGLARAVDDAKITHSGMIAGTPQFMSPEQARGEAVDPRSDLFSLGSVLYAVCTGRPPFRAETSYGVMRRITDDEPRPIREINPDVPEWLCQIINQLMSKRAADRYESAAEIAELLEACLAHVQQPTAAPLPASLVPQPKRGRFLSISRRWSGVIAMIATLGLGLLGMFAWQATEAPDITGKWTGPEWGEVVLEAKQPGEYAGTYTDTFKEKPGTIEVQWSRLEGRYKGTWREGQNRSGKISLRLMDDEIRGAWTTSKESGINPGTPELADLTWKRSGGTPAAAPATEIQIKIAAPQEMEIAVADQRGQFDKSPPFGAPARLNLHSGKIYRLHLAKIAGREGAEFYPTVETGPATPRVAKFLAHNSISIEFTEEDFDQALAGKFVTKVVYLPDPEFQELALAGVETLVSTRLEPGKDPITEADRRGSILAVIRLGNKDIELPDGGIVALGGPAERKETPEAPPQNEGDADAIALPKGLKFLAPHKQLHGLSLGMTEKEFLAIVESQKLKIRKTAADGKTTYWIPTGDGHTVIVMFGKGSDKCTGIQRLRGEHEPPDAASKTLQFSEAKEVVLSADSLKFMLDFDSGETMDMPATIGRPEQKQMDIQTDQVQPYHYPKELIGLGLQGVEVKESDWDASAADVRRVLASDRVEPLKQMDLGPEKHPTYFFKTRDGALGVLQLLEIVGEPKGIRLRYKVLTPPKSARRVELGYWYGKITEVRKDERVEITLGLNKYLEVGDKLDVVRDKVHLGRITVESVRSKTSIARIESRTGEFRVGDMVYTAPEIKAPGTPEPAPQAQPGPPNIGTPRESVDSAPNTSGQEKAVAKLVLVFFDDKSRRAVPCLVLNVKSTTFVITAGPATVVPDGTAHAIDRTFLELAGKEPIPVEYDTRSTTEFHVYRVKDPVDAIELQETAAVTEGDAVTAVSTSRVVPKRATVVGLGRRTQFELPDQKIQRLYEDLIEVDQTFPEGTPLFKKRKLVGLTLLGTRYVGETAKKSYVVPAARIVELCARLGLEDTAAQRKDASEKHSARDWIEGVQGKADDSPAYGDKQGDLQLGLQIKGEQRQFPIGSELKFDYIIKNVGKKRVQFEYVPLHPSGHAPRIRNGRGEKEAVSGVVTTFDRPFYAVTLEPDQVHRIPYSVILRKRSEGTLLASWESPKPGPYTLDGGLSLNVLSPMTPDRKAATALSSGTVAFEVVEAPQAENQAQDTKAFPKRLRQFSIKHRVNAIACSPDGKLIAITNSDVTFPLTADWKPVVEILDVQDAKPVPPLPLVTAEEREAIIATKDLPGFEVGPLVFSPDGAVLAVSTGLGQVKLFNARSGELIRALDDEKARSADKATPEKIKALPRAMGRIASIAFSPDGSLLATCGESFADMAGHWDRIERGGLGERATNRPGRLKVWDAKTGELKHDLAGHSHAFAVAFPPDGPWLASAGRWSTASSDGNGVLLWDLEKGAIHRTLAIEANGGTHAVAFSPTKKLSAMGSIIFDKENDTRSTALGVAYPLSGITQWHRTIQGVALPKGFSPDGKSIVVLSGRDSICLIDAESGQSQHEIKADKGSLWIDVALAPKAGVLIIAAAAEEPRGSIEIWDVGGPAAAADPGPAKDAENQGNQPDTNEKQRRQ